MCKRVLKEEISEDAEIPFFKTSTFGDESDTFITRSIFDDYVKKYPYPKI